MARFWDNKEVPGKGTKYCLVIDAEDGTNPIRTHGWSQDEVLDKMAKNVEVGQGIINRMRTTPRPERNALPEAKAPAVQLSVAKPTPEEMIQASIDITNPARATNAVKTMLKDAGIDVDQQNLNRKADQAVRVATEWERSTPAYPKDPRNDRILMDRALILANGDLGKITAEILTQAFEDCEARGTLFEPERETVNNPTDAARNRDSDTVVRPRGVTASSYRRNDLRATTPVTSRTPKYTRAEIDRMNTKEFKEKVLDVPDVLAWFNREFSAVA